MRDASRRPSAAATIPFNRPFVSGLEAAGIEEALASGYTGGNGPIARHCAELIAELTGAGRVFLTPSGTSALEMSALLADIAPGDEVLMPSFAFASTANAFVLRGATPVFVEIDQRTLGLDPERVEEALTKRTRAIVAVHYGGGAAEMDPLLDIARREGTWMIEDAAQGIFATYRGASLGTIGQLGVISFHETKNLSCGEGGALLVNDEELICRAEILQEKGTNRAQFVKGDVPAYTWIDVGSSFLMSELSAAILRGQLERGPEITAARRALWNAYHGALAGGEERGLLTRPRPQPHVNHNGHIYYVLAPDRARRDRVIEHLGRQGISARFHYVPLHSSPAGRRFGRTSGELALTEDIAARLVRLPLWVGMRGSDVECVAAATLTALAGR